MRRSLFIAMFIPIVGLAGCHSDRHANPASGSTPQTQSGTAQRETMALDQTFRRHYDSHYATSGYSYNQYRPAYRYGADLASDPRYTSQDWSTMEPIALRGWDSSKMGEWEQYKGAVRYGWETKRSK